MAALRGENGCPWDIDQTHESLRQYLLEEAYEVLETIDEGRFEDLKEELGDLLLQIMLHAQIASEDKEFDIEDVAQDIGTKLIRRHPHVFGNVKVDNAAEVILNWELLKKKERGEEGDYLLDSVPQGMPSLVYSQAIQRRVAQFGFDWEEVDGVLAKLVEEAGELKKAATAEQRTAEFGDLLFTLANLARRLEVDIEMALRQANERFCQRFSYMEKYCQQQRISLSTLSFDEQNALWEEAKRQATR